MKFIISSQFWSILLFHWLSVTLVQAVNSDNANDFDSGVKTVIELNDGDRRILPSLRAYKARLDFPPMNVDKAIVLRDDDARCILWSSKSFSWVFFNARGMQNASFFPDANRVYCIHVLEKKAMMVEDIHGNEQLVELEFEKSDKLNKNEARYKGKLKFPITVRRAVPLAAFLNECIFRSKTSFSTPYTLQRPASEPWPEPFQGAIEVYCFWNAV